MLPTAPDPHTIYINSRLNKNREYVEWSLCKNSAMESALNPFFARTTKEFHCANWIQLRIRSVACCFCVCGGVVMMTKDAMGLVFRRKGIQYFISILNWARVISATNGARHPSRVSTRYGAGVDLNFKGNTFICDSLTANRFCSLVNRIDVDRTSSSTGHRKTRPILELNDRTRFSISQ